MKKAVILLSGGLDSATTLYMAKDQGFDCYALSFDYGQKHSSELSAAKAIAESAGVIEHKIIPLNLRLIGGSALTDDSFSVPTDSDLTSSDIPVTYVPARNTVFLSIAMGYAEVIGSQNIFIGVNAVDYSGYPDCRPEFIHAFEVMANLATKASVEGQKLKINTPLIDLTKAEIVTQGTKLGLDYALTVSCYQADAAGKACGVCDSCRLRAQGFADAGLSDPTIYS
ncbi:7-cyano-7-deazaguanine synthase QueC [Gynuella sunshinyii]|uniref:7-cyano-7-deazaguanine synthase n=1 Tax=Gynuella sunshinyii YC6258 TaxID=1445510 RepID=A0A0C5VMQ6_9GAMM|nr:7-cyano-7-deazaguanine synthase QueC [Gynuella sunshinyii]AJQ94623.1 putative PP-loop superfamily ATPase [Gynuella sunshinyii YC6258]